MTTAEVRAASEIERIEAWRQEELERAGYPIDAARELAGRHYVDLHVAIDLVRSGCEPRLALQILL